MSPANESCARKQGPTCKHVGGSAALCLLGWLSIHRAVGRAGGLQAWRSAPRRRWRWESALGWHALDSVVSLGLRDIHLACATLGWPRCQSIHLHELGRLKGLAPRLVGGEGRPSGSGEPGARGAGERAWQTVAGWWPRRQLEPLFPGSPSSACQAGVNQVSRFSRLCQISLVLLAPPLQKRGW